MTSTKATVGALIRMDIDIDVVDDIDESVYVAMSGPIRLTAVGEATFAALMPVRVEIVRGRDHMDDVAIIQIDGSCGDGEETREAALLKMAYELFWGHAGYCSEEQYERWFRAEEEDPLERMKKMRKAKEGAV